MLEVCETGQCGQVPWSLEGGDRDRRWSLLLMDRSSGFNSFCFRLAFVLPGHFLHPFLSTCVWKETSRSQLSIASLPLFQAPQTENANTSPPPEAKGGKKSENRERTNHPFQPLLSMQSEGHMEINIFGSDNKVFLGVLIKCRRLLNMLLLGAHLRKPMLLFILNSDELSRAAHTPQLSLS